MKSWLITVGEPTIFIIDAPALVMILIGMAKDFVKGLSATLSSPPGRGTGNLAPVRMRVRGRADLPACR